MQPASTCSLEIFLFSRFCSICLSSANSHTHSWRRSASTMCDTCWGFTETELFFSLSFLFPSESRSHPMKESVSWVSDFCQGRSELWMQIFHIINLLHPLSSRCPSWIMDSRLWCLFVFLIMNNCGHHHHLLCCSLCLPGLLMLSWTVNHFFKALSNLQIYLFTYRLILGYFTQINILEFISTAAANKLLEINRSLFICLIWGELSGEPNRRAHELLYSWIFSHFLNAIFQM